jgi:endo-1,3(4)-beta-glucanase
MWKSLVLVPLMAMAAQCAVITDTINETITRGPVYVTVTAATVVVTKYSTELQTTTICNMVAGGANTNMIGATTTTLFEAYSKPTTTCIGTVNTAISTVSVPPVTQFRSYRTTHLSHSINPNTYSSNAVVTNTPKTTPPASVVGSSSSSSSIQQITGLSTPAVGQSTFSTAFISSAGLAVSSSVVLSSEQALSAVSSGQASSVLSSAQPSGQPGPAPTNYYTNGDIFAPVDTSAPPSVFPREALDIELPGGLNGGGNPIHTNKFYANLFLGSQHSPVYAQPYSIWWSNDANYYGMAISHTDFSQRVSPMALIFFLYMLTAGIRS